MKRTAMKGTGKKLRRARRAVKHSTAWLEQHLDAIVSELVRTITPYCVLCLESDPDKLSCGHYWKRFRRPTRWHLDNLATLCFDCNGKDNEMHGPYTVWLRRKLGTRRFDDLEELAHLNAVFNETELAEMLAGFKAILAEAIRRRNY